MSDHKVGRRDFLRKATALTAAGTAAFSWEEHHLLAHQQPPQGPPPGGRAGGGRGGQQPVADVAGPMPMGKLGPYQVSRLIGGHNLVGWQAHSRDLIYVSQLLRNYFTDDKVIETYKKSEEAGINAYFLRIEARSLKIAKDYKARGGKIQWIAQLVINEQDQRRDLDLALEAGAKIGYIRGLEGDRFFKSGQMDVLAKGIELAKKAGMTCGLAVHGLDCLIQAEKMGGLGADFYQKTFNSANYWSAGQAAHAGPELETDEGPARAVRVPRGLPRQPVGDDAEGHGGVLREGLQAVRRLQGPGRRRHQPARRLQVRVRQGRGLRLGRDVRLPAEGRRQHHQAALHGQVPGQNAPLAGVARVREGRPATGRPSPLSRFSQGLSGAAPGRVKVVDDHGVVQTARPGPQEPSILSTCTRLSASKSRSVSSRDRMKAALVSASDSVAFPATTLTWHIPSTGSPLRGSKMWL